MALEGWQRSWCKPYFVDAEQTDGKGMYQSVAFYVPISGVLSLQAQCSPQAAESELDFHVNVITHIIF